MQSNATTAEYCVAVGSHAMDALTTGGNNTAVGHNCLKLNTTVHKMFHRYKFFNH